MRQIAGHSPVGGRMDTNHNFSFPNTAAPGAQDIRRKETTHGRDSLIGGMLGSQLVILAAGITGRVPEPRDHHRGRRATARQREHRRQEPDYQGTLYVNALQIDRRYASVPGMGRYPMPTTSTTRASPAT